jgi:hypothetical protein
MLMSKLNNGFQNFSAIIIAVIVIIIPFASGGGNVI